MDPRPSLPGGAVDPRRGGGRLQNGPIPGLQALCMSVEPREAPEGSVFRITGRGWRPGRRVKVFYGAYCFSFRVRAGNRRVRPAARSSRRRESSSSGCERSPRDAHPDR